MNTRIEELEKHLEALTRMQLTTRREINNFKEELQQLKQEEQAWPQKNQWYWFIDSKGKAKASIWQDIEVDSFRQRSIIFRTKEEAERHALRLRIYNSLWAMADKNGSWAIIPTLGSYKPLSFCFKGIMPYTPSFSTEEKAQAALDTVSDDLKKLQEMSDE